MNIVQSFGIYVTRLHSFFLTILLGCSLIAEGVTESSSEAVSAFSQVSSQASSQVASPVASQTISQAIAQASESFLPPMPKLDSLSSTTRVSLVIEI